MCAWGIDGLVGAGVQPAAGPNLSHRCLEYIGAYRRHQRRVHRRTEQIRLCRGQNLVILAEGYNKSRDEFPAVAKQFAEVRVDAIVAMSGAIAIRAAQAATQSIPIVGIADEMVLEGQVRSIANHGGNTTGLSLLAAQLDGKRQEILMELLPSARRMAVIYDAAFKLADQMEELKGAADTRDIALSIYPVHMAEEVAAALEAAKAAGVEAVNFLASPLFSVAFRKANFAKALGLGLPATHHWPEGARDGAENGGPGGAKSVYPRIGRSLRPFSPGASFQIKKTTVILGGATLRRVRRCASKTRR